MINPINPGCILPIYPNRMGNLSTHHDGYGVLASNKNFIPFHFALETVTIGAAPQQTFSLEPIGNGTRYVFPDSAISTYTSDTHTYIFYNGEPLATAIECGEYELKIDYKGKMYWSEPTEVKDLSCGYQRAGLAYDTVAFSIDIVADDVLSGPLVSSTFQVSTGGAFSIAALPFTTTLGASYQLRRTVVTACGAHTASYSVINDTLVLLNPLPSPNDVAWSLTIEYDQNSNDILYGEGYKQVFYFNGPLAGQEFEDSPERLSNGNGKQFLKYAETRDLITVTASNVSDAVLSGLYEGKHKTATLTRIGDSNSLTVDGYEIAVTPATFNHFNTVSLTFERAVYTTQFCEPDLIVTAV